MADLRIIETGNGGDLELIGRDLSMVEGFENMPYLGMFGGNVEASTAGPKLANEQAFDWWGNNLLMFNNQSIQFNSDLERALNQIPLTSAGRVQLEQIVYSDLKFMLPFAELEISTSIIATDNYKIEIKIIQPDNLEDKQFVYIWDATNSTIQLTRDRIIQDPQAFSEGFSYGFN